MPYIRKSIYKKILPDGVMVAHVILVHIVGVRIPIGELLSARLLARFLLFARNFLLVAFRLNQPRVVSLVLSVLQKAKI